MPEPTPNPTIPFTPEPTSTLKHRYLAALERVFDQEAIVRGESQRPGELHAHVFDFEDGIRLIISNERNPDGLVRLHVSGSFEPTLITEGSFLKRHLPVLRNLGRDRGKQETFITNRLIAELGERFRDLSGRDITNTKPDLVSAGGIPHWLLSSN